MSTLDETRGYDQMQEQRPTLSGKLRGFQKESSCCNVNTSAYLRMGSVGTESQGRNWHIDSESVTKIPSSFSLGSLKQLFCLWIVTYKWVSKSDTFPAGVLRAHAFLGGWLLFIFHIIGLCFKISLFKDNYWKIKRVESYTISSAV